MVNLTSIDILGRWSSNTVKGEKTSSLIVNKNLLIECGPHTVEALLDQNFDPLKIDTVAITHMHLDHYVGLAEFLWYRAIYAPRLTVNVLGPNGIIDNTRSLLNSVRTPEYFDINVEYYENKAMDDITPFRANHIIDDNGYRIEYGNLILFYSGDTAYSENVIKGAEQSDYLFHEMTYSDEKKKEAEFWKHSTYSDTIMVFKESKAKRLVPVHLSAQTLDLIRTVSKTNGDISLANEGRFIL